jgi:hypothetical protein
VDDGCAILVICLSCLLVIAALATAKLVLYP